MIREMVVFDENNNHHCVLRGMFVLNVKRTRASMNTLCGLERARITLHDRLSWRKYWNQLRDHTYTPAKTAVLEEHYYGTSKTYGIVETVPNVDSTVSEEEERLRALLHQEQMKRLKNERTTLEIGEHLQSLKRLIDHCIATLPNKRIRLTYLWSLEYL